MGVKELKKVQGHKRRPYHLEKCGDEVGHHKLAELSTGEREEHPVLLLSRKLGGPL